MTDLQTVWVVEPVGYDQYGIEGIYHSLEAAKASQSGVEWREDGRPDWWTSAGADPLSGGLSIYSTEVQTLDSVRVKHGPVPKKKG